VGNVRHGVSPAFSTSSSEHRWEGVQELGSGPLQEFQKPLAGLGELGNKLRAFKTTEMKPVFSKTPVDLSHLLGSPSPETSEMPLEKLFPLMVEVMLHQPEMAIFLKRFKTINSDKTQHSQIASGAQAPVAGHHRAESCHNGRFAATSGRSTSTDAKNASMST
jgi:hypothetical protein